MKEINQKFSQFNEAETINYNKILIILFFIVLIFFIFYLNKKIENVSSSLDKKITNLEHSIKLTDYKYYLLNQQFKTIFSYIFNFKNESSIYKLLSPRSISGKKK